MYAEDFTFNGRKLTDSGFRICSFDGSEPTFTPSAITFITSELPTNSRKHFVVSKREEPISMTFSIIRYECPDGVKPVDLKTDISIHKWLEREDGFHKLVFLESDYKDIYFNAQVNLTPHTLNGIIYGYDVTVVTDNAYAYGNEVECEFDTQADIPCQMTTVSDRMGYIYPYIEITPKTDGNLAFNITEDANQSYTVFSSAKANQTIKINSELYIIENYDTVNDKFNWKFPRLLQGEEETVNTITTTLDCHVVIKYVPLKAVSL